MEMLFIVIPLSLGLVAFALWSFIWSVKNDQFDDLERQGWFILFDDNKNADRNPDKNTQPSGEKTDEH